MYVSECIRFYTFVCVILCRRHYTINVWVWVAPAIRHTHSHTHMFVYPHLYACACTIHMCDSNCVCSNNNTWKYTHTYIRTLFIHILVLILISILLIVRLEFRHPRSSFVPHCGCQRASTGLKFLYLLNFQKNSEMCWFSPTHTHTHGHTAANRNTHTNVPAMCLRVWVHWENPLSPLSCALALALPLSPFEFTSNCWFFNLSNRLTKRPNARRPTDRRVALSCRCCCCAAAAAAAGAVVIVLLLLSLFVSVWYKFILVAPLRRRRRRRRCCRRRRHRYYYFFYYVYVSGAHCGACAAPRLLTSPLSPLLSLSVSVSLSPTPAVRSPLVSRRRVAAHCCCCCPAFASGWHASK